MVAHARTVFGLPASLKVPVQAPDQLVNSELASGFAVSVTDVPLANFALHVEPQLIPDGLL